jgi:cbb3-type cytochrome oxidase maturation protein
MEIVYLLVPLSLVLAFLIGAVFWWAIRRGQFDDLEGPAHRILMDDDRSATSPFKGEKIGERVVTITDVVTGHD